MGFTISSLSTRNRRATDLLPEHAKPITHERRRLELAATPGDYRALLRRFTELGYRNGSFHQFDPAAPELILRHDIDLSLDYAVRMGDIDGEEGWRASFFILIASEFYNPASRAGRTAIGALMSMGHEIGLHFDAAAHTGDDDALERAAIRECSILEDIIGAPIRVTAFHRPASFHPRFLGKSGPFAGRPHAYEPRFFSEAAYLSDGAGCWSHGHPLDHPFIAQRRGMQLLTHPFRWMAPGSNTERERIGHLLDERAGQLMAEAARNFRRFR